MNETFIRKKDKIYIVSVFKVSSSIWFGSVKSCTKKRKS